MLDKILTWLMDSQSGAALVGAFFGAIFAFAPAWLLQVREHRKSERDEWRQLRRGRLLEIHAMSGVLTKRVSDRLFEIVAYVLRREAEQKDIEAPVQFCTSMVDRIARDVGILGDGEGGSQHVSETCDRLCLLMEITPGYEHYADPLRENVLAAFARLQRLTEECKGLDAQATMAMTSTCMTDCQEYLVKIAESHVEVAEKVRRDLLEPNPTEPRSLCHFLRRAAPRPR